jgi:hypothetical protein
MAFKLCYSTTADSNIENVALSQSISANTPVGITVIGVRCPKSIFERIGKSVRPSSKHITFKICFSDSGFRPVVINPLACLNYQ